MTPSTNRFEQNFHILNKWLCLRQRGQSLLSYFEDNLLCSAAIYGMGTMGERMFDELRGLPVEIAYGIDRMAGQKRIPGLKIYDLNIKEYPQTDVIIVTPVSDYWNIVEQLKEKTKVPIVSLEDVVDYVYHK